MRFLSLLLMLFLCNVLTAQNIMKWGKVSNKELKMTTYDKDPDAVAVVLGDVGSLRYGDMGINYKRHTRIKILKKEGLDYANQEVSYYYRGNKRQLKKLEAQIVNPDGQVVKLSKKDFFEEKTTKYRAKKKFTLPNVQVGAIIEYRYTLTQAYSTPYWNFQREIPVKWSEYTFEHPVEASYAQLSQGSQLYHIKEVEKGGYQAGKYVITDIHHFVMKDVAALKAEAYITTMDDYLTNVRFQLQNYTMGGKSKDFINTWEELAKQLYKQKSFGKQFKVNTNHRKISQALEPIKATAGDEPMGKIMAAYHFITNRLKWDGDDGFTLEEESFNEVWENKKGNSAAINLIFVLALQELGLNAKPALTSTRTHGKLLQTYPFVSQFNYVLAHVEIDGKFVLLDATSGMKMPDLLNPDALNRYAWVVDEKEPKWVDIFATRTNTTNSAKVSIDEEGILSGDLACRADNYQAYFMRADLEEKKPKEVIQEFFDEELSAEIENIAIKNEKDFKEKLSFTAQFSTENAAEINGDLIYINAVLLDKQTENPFKSEKREFPVDMAYPFKDQYIFELNIPEGYGVEELPENVSMTLLDKAAKFQFLATEKAGTVQIVSKVILTRTVYSPEEYKSIREFYDAIVEKHASQIVLKKK